RRAGRKRAPLLAVRAQRAAMPLADQHARRRGFLLLRQHAARRFALLLRTYPPRLPLRRARRARLKRDEIGVHRKSRSIFLFEHDLRANAVRLSRGKTGSHFFGSCFSSSKTVHPILEAT